MGAVFGHGCAGGSEGMANRALGLSLGLVKNRMDTHSNAPNLQTSHPSCVRSKTRNAI